MSEDPVPYSARRRSASILRRWMSSFNRPRMAWEYVVWRDSRGGGGWVPASEIDAEPAEIHSVGWVVSETPTAIVLAASVESRDHGGRHVLDPLTIPLSAVLERRSLRLAD
jgi:hypothetical protein